MPPQRGHDQRLYQSTGHCSWGLPARPSLAPDLFPWDSDSSAFDVAHQIRCPVLVVAGSDEPDIFRRQAEQFASLVPTATLKIWRGGGHGARNIPDALEQAVDWMKEQLGSPHPHR